MQFYIYIFIIILFTLLPTLGLIINVDHWFSYDISGMFEANLIFDIIIYVGIFIAFNKIKKLHYKWHNFKTFTNPNKYLIRIKKYCYLFCIIQFILRGYLIFSGVDRGTVRVSLGIWGPLTTFISLYSIPALLSLSTVIFFYTKKDKNTKHNYYCIIISAILVALMSGGKANIILMMFPAIIQVASKINLKNLF